MFKDLLAQGALAMGIALSPEQLGQFALYHQMLSQAGRTMNLTRVSASDQESVPRHYLDSLTLLAHPGLLQGATALADVGSGAGLPGLAFGHCPAPCSGDSHRRPGKTGKFSSGRNPGSGS